jgi:hypothetical protein
MLYEPAILKLKHAFHSGRQIWSVRYQDERHAFLAVQFNQQASQVFRGGAVKGAGWFVGQQKFRLVNQGTHHGDSLPFPSGKLAGTMINPAAQPYAIQQPPGALRRTLALRRIR